VVITVSVVRIVLSVGGREKPRGEGGVRRVEIAVKNVGRQEHGCCTVVRVVQPELVCAPSELLEVPQRTGCGGDEDEMDFGVAGSCGTEIGAVSNGAEKP